MNYSKTLFVLRRYLLYAFFCLTLPLVAQQSNDIKISGVVTDGKEPLPGVSVTVKGTSQGAATNVDGLFILSVPKNSTLVVSYIGYLTQEIKITNQTSINIILVEDAKKLDDVVVVGYGTQRKISTIGAQSSVKVITELKQPVANMTNSIAGRIAGVVAVQRSAEPGNDNSDIWIRGISTFSNSTPLILVDGVEREFNNIDSEDIESFSILKDASATAVYGVKGANGVVLVTTKQGVKGKPKIRMEYMKGFTSFTKVPDFADGVTYMQMANEALTTRGYAPKYSEEAIYKTYTRADPYLYPNVDWMDVVFNDFGQNQKMNMSVSGGSEFAQFYVSFGMYDEQGMYKTNDLEQYNSKISYTRYNFATNLKMQVTKSTEITLGVKGYVSDKNAPSTSASDLFQFVMRAYPIAYPVTYPNGELAQVWGGGDMRNPYGLLTRRGYHATTQFQTYSDIRLNQNLEFITKGLSFKTLFSFDAYSQNVNKRENGSPTNYLASGRDPETGELILVNQGGTDLLGYSTSTTATRQYYLESSLNYERKFGDHRTGALLLYNQTDYNNNTADNLQSSLPYRSLGVAGRVTYSYLDKYMFEGNFGYNGAENFAPGKRFGFFPSAGLGWVISSEDFYEPLESYVQFLKLRFSHGMAGNSKLNQSRRFAYLATVNTNSGGYTYGNTRQNGITGYEIQDYAADVTWETSTKTNYGLDFNLFDNNLAIQADLFSDRRENIFLNRKAVPDFVGLQNTLLGNLGVVDNWGYEITADWSQKIGELTLGLRGNYTFNRSTIVEDDTPYKPYPWMNSRGLPVNYRMGYISEGLFTQEEIDNPTIARNEDMTIQAGDVRFRDLNEDGIINENDKTRIGYNPVPEVMYGFGVTAAWKGFNFGAFFQGAANVEFLINGTDFIPFEQGSARGNVYANILERWNEANPNPNAIWPRLSYGTGINQNYAASTYWLRDGSYIRLKTLDFGYNIPNNIVKKLGINNARIYMLGYNLLTFSKFDMWDVELGQGNGSQYPNISTYSLGFNFSF